LAASDADLRPAAAVAAEVAKQALRKCDSSDYDQDSQHGAFGGKYAQIFEHIRQNFKKWTSRTSNAVIAHCE